MIGAMLLDDELQRQADSVLSLAMEMELDFNIVHTKCRITQE